MAENTLTITDNRTGKQYELAIENETIKALDFRKIKVADDDFGLMTYDPAFMNTASTRSRITLPFVTLTIAWPASGYPNAASA